MAAIIADGVKGGNEARVIDGALCVEVGTDDLGSDQNGDGGDGVIVDDEKGGGGARVTGGRLWVVVVP